MMPHPLIMPTSRKVTMRQVCGGLRTQEGVGKADSITITSDCTQSISAINRSIVLQVLHVYVITKLFTSAV